ncbi:MAG: anaerobic ribonucleoside-triphosphate reductase activating protein [Candidatus Pacearchaeota archaeon]
MRIIGLEKNSFIDYSGKCSLVIFTKGCNFNCPTCHNKIAVKPNKRTNLIKEEEIFYYLEKRKKFIDGLVISGGEPTIQKDLISFLEKCKKEKIQIKLDTNGYKPDILEEILEKNLVDYVALDIKGPKNIYSDLVGINIDIKRIEESIKIVSKFSEYEFRTTIVPIKRNKDYISWMKIEELKDTLEWVYNIIKNKESKYFLQKFFSREEKQMLNKNFSLNYLSKELHETPNYLIEEMKKIAKKYFPKIEIRD